MPDNQLTITPGFEPVVIPGERVANDYYPTPEAITDTLLRIFPELAGQEILEPCSGNGAISDVLRRAGCTVRESDITILDGENRDATTADFWEGMDTNWVVTNPPFKEAESILPHSLDCADYGVAFLLRLTYLEPTEGRGKWLQDHADNLRFVIPVNPRPRFRRGTSKTDSVTSAWFVWDKRWSWQKLGIECPFVFATGWRSNP